VAYMCPLPQGYSGAIKKERGTENLNRAWIWAIRDAASDWPQAGCSALFLDGAGGRLPGSYKPGLQGLGWNTARG